MNTDQIIALGAEYGTPLLKALAILVVGWLIAKAVAHVLVKVLHKTDIDNKLADKLTGGRGSDLPIEEGLGKFVYWFILLFVFMAVFQALGLTIITEPLNALVTKITSYLPQILAAAGLALLAWMVATVLRMIVSNLLGAFQLDEKIGESTGEEEQKLSLAATLSDGLYYLVFLFFLPQILDALQMDGLAPVRDMVGEILGFLPNLLGAVVVFAIFFFVAKIVQRLVTNVLKSFGFDNLPAWLGFEGAKEGAQTASSIAGYVVLTILLFLGAIQAANTLGLAVVSGLANELLQGLFAILVAVVIFAIGLFLSRLAYKAIVASGHGQSTVLANVARFAILILTGAMALHRTNLAPEIVNLAFGALIVGLAVAAGLAFGLGGREEAARVIASWRSKEE